MDQRDALKAMGVQEIPDRTEARVLGRFCRPEFIRAAAEKRVQAAANRGAALVRPAGRTQSALNLVDQPACRWAGEDTLRPSLAEVGATYEPARPSSVEIEHAVAPRLIGPGIAGVDLARGQDDDISRP